MDNVRKETHVVSVMNKPRETVAEVRDEKDKSSSPAPNSKAKTDGEGEKTQKNQAPEMKSSSDKRSKIPCRYRK